jgi:hypothetical protein
MPADVEPRDALRALRALRSEKEAPPGAMHRVMDRLSATLAIAPALLDASPDAPPPLPHGVGPVTAIARPWLAKAIWLLSGTAIGLGVHRGLDRPHVEPPARLLPTAPIAAPPSSPEPDTSITEAPPAPRATAPRSTARRETRATDLAQERALLDAARRSWTEGDATACLTKLDDHARTFGRGQLAEEREALRINALVATGQYDAARDEAAAFSRNHPRSFLAPSVAAALEAIP